MSYFTKKLSIIAVIFFSIILFYSCEELEETDKYRRPEWLEGKLYDQIKEIESLSVFSEAIRLSNYDTIINVSGTYTIFAPNNEAFDQFFNEHPEYNGSLENIDRNELIRLVKFHIIQNPWNREQLKSLNPGGWITSDDHPINSKPWSYKWQTLLSNENEKYFYREEKGVYNIVDSANSEEHRIVVNEKRKYAPIYFDEYFSLNNLDKKDYTFYFNRSFDAGSIYYVNGKAGKEIFAENGFIYPIDQVVPPLKNAREILEEGLGEMTFNHFLKLIYQFPEFSFNKTATFNQASAIAGSSYDSLFNLSYPDLIFNIHEEEFKGSFSQSTRRHYGMVVPDDAAFQKMINEIFTTTGDYTHWANLDEMPVEIKKLILNAHMSEFPIYETNIKEGFYNGLDDIVTIENSKIKDKYYGSNCTFLAVSEAVLPRAFVSVTAPVYLRPGYSTFMRAMEYSKVLPALKRPGTDYAFFVLSNNTMELDSSLMLNWTDEDLNLFNFKALVKSDGTITNMSRTELGKRILNQVATNKPTGSNTRKEFLENLAGNFIVFDHERNIVRGTSENVLGYRGDDILPDSPPIKLNEPMDNGETYEVKTWFGYSRTNLFAHIQSNSDLYGLMVKAGLIDATNYEFTFINDGDYYTVFAPSNKAIEESGIDTLAKDDLKNILLQHFIRDHLIFTDGKKPSGFYETAKLDDENTNDFSVSYSTIQLNTGPDYIDILDKQDNVLYRVEENGTYTNKTGITITDEEGTYWDFITTSVVHQIETVLK